MGIYQLKTHQDIEADLSDVWNFVSSPRNLKNITPPYMGFEITTVNLPEKMYAGMIIRYKVSPVMGIKLNWLTEITHVKENCYFVDEQRQGPYKLWHHQHILKPTDRGVAMTDIVTYSPPMGFLGAAANALFIKQQLDEIFSYRRAAIEKVFSKETAQNSVSRSLS